MTVSPLLLVAFGLIGIIAGRLVFDRWFNHLTIYSLIWGAGLAMFEMRLIDYYPLVEEVWMLIGYAWVAFAAGSVIAIMAQRAVGVSPASPMTATPGHQTASERRIFSFAILVLSAIALISTLRRWLVLINMFGSIPGVLVNGYTIYRMRIAGETPGAIPYLSSFALAAILICGLYCARAGKIKFIVLIPLLIIILDDVSMAGRAKMSLGVALFISGYFLARPQARTDQSFRTSDKLRWMLTFSLIFSLLLVAAEFVRSYRGAYERFYGASQKLSKLEQNAFLTPSIYLYLSSHVGVFNAYWKAGGERYFPGSNTLAPVFRILAKLRVGDPVPHFTKFYNTPVSSNTGTYLRELHADFGVAGIMIAPFVLGWACTLLWSKVRTRSGLATIALLAHFYVIVVFSFLYQITRVGEWFVSLAVSLFVSGLISHSLKNSVATGAWRT
ncbi:oligosaccharide repeat unit polymerase [bacterium]|nr:oligosaccharide repeat unit polymerase [bacterium]